MKKKTISINNSRLNLKSKAKVSIPIVIDEWLFEDLLGTYGLDRQIQTFSFIQKMYSICDRFVILRGSKFQEKYTQFIKKSQANPLLKFYSNFFRNFFITNSRKIEWINPTRLIPLSKSLMKKVNIDDHYLFQTHFCIKNSFILTTDMRLIDAVRNVSSVIIKSRDTYVKQYLAEDSEKN